MARKGRVRQTRTSWQKTFDPHPGMVGSISWIDRMPEILHISIALYENDYQQVEADFFHIADFVNKKYAIRPEFHFNLTHAIRLIKDDPEILIEINKTCFKNAFNEILFFYRRMVGADLFDATNFNPKLLLVGYHQVLKGRSDTAILCKYLMMKYMDRNMDDLPEPFQMYGHNNREEILDLTSVSQVFARFPITAGSSGYLDLEFCHDMWMENYLFSPFLPPSDIQAMEENEYKEIGFENLKDNFQELYARFKSLRLITVIERPIAEVLMGFVGRIGDLTLQIMEFDRTFKGEISDLVLRSLMESFIVGSWLIKRKDPALFIRFREYSTGRERLFGETLAGYATTEEMKKNAAKLIDDAVEEAGVHNIEVATERGDAFELRIDQMADEVFGKDNMYYFLFKRLSDVTHGHWRTIAKHHLVKSINPMQDSLYDYDDNLNTYSGLIPSFMALNMSLEMMIAILEDIDVEDINEFKESLKSLHAHAWSKYMEYYKKYLSPNEKGENEE